jgi:peroxiredoxin
MILLNGKNISDHQFRELPDFNLKNIDDKFISSKELINNRDGLLVMFICNHCPYVKAIIKNIVQDSSDLLNNLNIASVAINSNDPSYNQEDSFENMKKFASNNQFALPYLFDETQKIAQTFDAVCTPDFFLFIRNHENNKFILSHKGRLNDFIYTKDGKQTSENENVQHELYIIAQYLTGKTKNSMGCSIKWKK